MQLTRASEESIAAGFGCLSIGLGLAELAATHRVARSIGMYDGGGGLMRTMGVREITNGIAILAQPRRPEWMWARVAGDAIDLALIGLAFGRKHVKLSRLGVAATLIAGVATLDVLFAQQLSSRPYRHVGRRWLTRGRGLRLQQSIAINCPPEQAYGVCRDIALMSGVVPGILFFAQNGGNRVRLQSIGSAPDRVEIELELLEEQPAQMMSWRSINRSPVEIAGSFRFFKAPGNRGTVLRAEVLLRPTEGVTSKAMVFAARPDAHLRASLRRIKALIETGEIPTTKGQPSGRPSTATPVDAEVGEPMNLRALMAR